VGFSNSKSNGEAKKKAMLSELKSFMSPELLGRIDEVIVFNDLTLSDMENITRLEISALEKRLSELGCTLACQPEVYHFIAKQALSKSGSAREIITALIENRISDMLISSACRDFSVGVSENTLTVAQHRRQLCS
jgi:ATP-dependent Clp protease ATP-binding subunit ClpC